MGRSAVDGPRATRRVGRTRAAPAPEPPALPPEYAAAFEATSALQQRGGFAGAIGGLGQQFLSTALAQAAPAQPGPAPPARSSRSRTPRGRRRTPQPYGRPAARHPAVRPRRCPALRLRQRVPVRRRDTDVRQPRAGPGCGRGVRRDRRRPAWRRRRQRAQADPDRARLRPERLVRRPPDHERARRCGGDDDVRDGGRPPRVDGQQGLTTVLAGGDVRGRRRDVQRAGELLVEQLPVDRLVDHGHLPDGEPERRPHPDVRRVPAAAGHLPGGRGRAARRSGSGARRAARRRSGRACDGCARDPARDGTGAHLDRMPSRRAGTRTRSGTGCSGGGTARGGPSTCSRRGRPAGRSLGQEVTGGIGPVTCYGPDEPVTHAFPPVTDERYAGSPLAEAVAAARARRPQRRGRADPRRAPGGGRGRLPAARARAACSARSRASASSCSSDDDAWPGPTPTSPLPGGRSALRDRIDRAGHARATAGRVGYRLVGRTVRGAAGRAAPVAAPGGGRRRDGRCSASGVVPRRSPFPVPCRSAVLLDAGWSAGRAP